MFIIGLLAPIVWVTVTFVDGDVGVTEFDSEKGVCGGFFNGSTACDTSDADYFFLIDFGEIDGRNDANDIFDASMGVDDHGVVLLDVDESRGANEFH